MTIIQPSKKQFADAADHARADYIDYVTRAHLIPSRVADAARRKKQYYNAQGQEEGSSVEEFEDDDQRATSDKTTCAPGGPDPGESLADAYKQYEDELVTAWKHDRRKKQTTTHVRDPLEAATSDKKGK